MRWFWRLLRWLYCARAIRRGPGDLAGYATRRLARQLAWRMTRRW